MRHILAENHTMELPRLIEIGEENIGGFGRFLCSLAAAGGGGSRTAGGAGSNSYGDNYNNNNNSSSHHNDNNNKPADSRRHGCVSIISGSNVRHILHAAIEESLEDAGMKYQWHDAGGENSPDSLVRMQKKIVQDACTDTGMIAGIGGGRSVDIAKMIAHNLGRPFVSVPTAASHDGMASPFVSIKSNRPHSITASTPLGVFVDIGIIKNAPPRLLASGCGDLIANLIAVRDWRLGHKRRSEYYGRYAAELATMSAMMVMENSAEFAASGTDARLIVEGLISAGVASCIAGSSRPCSGAEHLFSHALDAIAPGVGLHGEKCGIGSIMMAKLHGDDWRRIAGALADVGAPTSAEQIGLDPAKVVDALCMAQGLRPERYTILSETNMTKEKAQSLAKSTGII